MERLLVAGDTHGNINHVRHLIAVAKRHQCEAIMVLGDWGFWEHFPEGVKFHDLAERHAWHEGVLIYFIDGNHDKTSLLMAKYGDDRDEEGFVHVRRHVLYAPRGHRWTWSGTRFIALGGAYSVDKAYRLEVEARKKKPESQWFPEEEMTDEDMAKILLDGSPVDVMLAHDKPRASNPSWNRKDFPECLPNQDRLQLAAVALQPSLFLHGHLHYRYTDHIRIGGDQWCRVEAFEPDPDAGERGYDRAHSRAILHVAEKRIEEIP